MKKCIIIPDSFKGTMSSEEVCNIEYRLLSEAFPECRFVTLPVADGGEGTLSCFLHGMNGERIKVSVQDAFGWEIESGYGRFGDFAVIEMAAAAGMVTNNLRDPMTSSTYGVGQLIDHAVSSGCGKILIGLGGSCTNDAGTGMAAALGTVFYNEQGEAFMPTGESLDEIVRIDNSVTERKIAGIEISCMCDIDNPLYGENGAAYVFAPQKGADEKQVELLDRNLRVFADTVLREMKIDISCIRGGGAAGGMGAGACAFLGAELKKGIDYILDIMEFDELLEGCDLVITGEGRLDMQSLMGKVASGVGRRAAARGVPAVAVVGCISDEMKTTEARRRLNDVGIRKVYPASDGSGRFEEITESCRRDLEAAVGCMINDIYIGHFNF